MELFESAIDGIADTLEVRMKTGASVCVIAASGGYPGKVENGKVIEGLESAGSTDDVVVFHSGTALKDGQMVTAGGRVLGVTAVGDDLREALDKAYSAMGQISFEGMQYRRDIGWRALAK
jgi:phosphoribosylamine---glycine ligase